MQKSSNFYGTPRTLADSTFHAWGDPIDRPQPRRRDGWKLATWALLMVVGIVLLAVAGRA